MFWLTLLVFLLILGLLVFVHELGHFLAAKISGVKVEEFAFGFPPRVICHRRGETKYCINLIPFGGYVKMLGEEGDSDSPRSFSKKRARNKLFIIVAGVVMNFILAGFLFSAGYMIGMSPIRINSDVTGGVQESKVIIAQVNEDSPAQQSGLEVGDVIKGFESGDAFSEFTKDNLGKSVDVTILRNGEEITKEVKVSEKKDAPIGVGVVDVPTVKLGFLRALKYGFLEMILVTAYIFSMLKEVFIGLFRGQIAGNIAGPVGIFNLTGEAVKMGVVYIIQWTALLSINLGLINILPLPALDGGRAVFILLEGIFRRKIVKAEIENILHFIGFVLLIIAIIALTFSEVAALF